MEEEDEVGKEKGGDKESPKINNQTLEENPKQKMNKAKSCKGCLLYSSTLNSNSRNPLCLGILRSLPQVPRHIVGESEVDASREGRSLAEFKYACVGYSVYSNGKDPTADVQETQAELPVCVGLEVLYDKRVNAADSVPAHVHSREGTAPRTSPAASHMPLATFKDHATLQNPWSTCGNHNLSLPPPKSFQAVHQEMTSDTLEETDDITFDTSEEAQILADLLEANGVNKLFDKLEAPFAPSNLLLGTFSNEAATHIQKGLTISLQSITDVNGMIAVANNVFMILKSLGVDFISFYEKVKIFLGCFALKTQLADSSNLSTAEFEAQYYEKKLHFDKVSGEHEQLSVSIIKSDEHIAGLNQRIIQIKELLKQLEEELSSTQAEHASFMYDFAQASESVSKSEEAVQTALNVLSQHKKKNGQHSVVECAFERARASLNE